MTHITNITRLKQTFILLILFTSIACYSQQGNISDSIFRAPQILFLGIDFSHAQILNETDKHIQKLQESILQEINLKFLKNNLGSLRRTFSKDILTEEKLFHSFNSNFSETLDLNNANIQKVVAGYPLTDKEGIGLVFLVGSLHKRLGEVEITPVFFDLSTRRIIWYCNESGSHNSSPGLMQYWYSKVNDAIGKFNAFYRLQKAIKNNKIKPNNFFLKLMVDEMDLGYEKTLNRNFTISAQAGYRFNYLNSWNYQGNYIGYLYRFLFFHGPTLNVDLKVKASTRSSIGFALGYQYLSCPKITMAYIDNSGSYDNISKTWKEYNNELVFQLQHFINLGNPPYPVQLFYGIGIKACMISEHYFNEYTPNIPVPGQQVVNVTTLQPVITFGLIIKLVSF